MYVKESIHSVVVVNRTFEIPIVKSYHNHCYSDFTVGILKVLLTTTTGCIDSLTYIIQPHAH
jgi:hypothetical protein